jgi:hypothetical protein
MGQLQTDAERRLITPRSIQEFSPLEEKKSGNESENHKSVNLMMQILAQQNSEQDPKNVDTIRKFFEAVLIPKEKNTAPLERARIDQKQADFVDALSRIPISDLLQLHLPVGNLPPDCTELLNRVFCKHVVTIQQQITESRTENNQEEVKALQKTLKKIFKVWLNNNMVDKAIFIAKNKLSAANQSYVMQFIVKALVEPKDPEQKDLGTAYKLAQQVPVDLYRDATLEKVISGFKAEKKWISAFEASEQIKGKSKAGVQCQIIMLMLAQNPLRQAELQLIVNFIEKMPPHQEKKLALEALSSSEFLSVDNPLRSKIAALIAKNESFSQMQTPQMQAPSRFSTHKVRGG